MIRRIRPFVALVLLGACVASKKSPTPQPVPPAPPAPQEHEVSKPVTDEKVPDAVEEHASENFPEFVAPQREMRGVWIATVANIDWPSSGTDSFEKQKQDFLQILDFYKQHNFNAVFVQVRAAGDAFYSSRLAPWSRYLTGKEGKAPDTKVDPLVWMIQAVHERGMEFHAWLNPYRATFNLDRETLSPEHDYFRHPGWMVKYGTKYYYNPGLPEVRKHMLDIVGEVVRNYEVDGIHFDDYFYPYKIANVHFDDQAAFNKYGNGMALDDWRRKNVDLLIQSVGNLVHTEKPWVQFGVSPFGVWRNASVDPQGSDTRAGQTNYDDLYADPLSWVNNGWVDYLVPQIYWSMDFPQAAHKKLVQWWGEKAKGTKIYIGNGPYKIRNDADQAWKDSYEIPNQVALARQNEAIKGNVYFRARSLMGGNRDVAGLLMQNLYNKPVLAPGKALTGVIQNLQPVIDGKHMSTKGLQLSIGNAYLAKSVVLYGYSRQGKWEMIEEQYTATSIDGETFMFDHFLLHQYDYLALGFLGNYGESSEVKIWRP
ncbi:hypothetical protein GCM10028791_33830 [Echinicola sediminis]